MTNRGSAQREKKGAGVLLACWECRAALGGTDAAANHFCAHCGKVQPLAGQTDYFRFFALPRQLGLDAAELEKQFHQLSWQLHPDRFHTAGAYEQELSLERTALLNDAYRTLRDPVSRVGYLLALEGVRKEGEVKQQAPPDLLEEVFALNEYLEELRTAKRSGGDAHELEDLRHRLEKTRQIFQQKLDAVLAELTAQFPLWDQALQAGRDGRPVLERLSEILNRHSYIRNLVHNVTEELES